MHVNVKNSKNLDLFSFLTSLTDTRLKVVNQNNYSGWFSNNLIIFLNKNRILLLFPRSGCAPRLGAYSLGHTDSDCRDKQQTVDDVSSFR